MSDKYDRAAEGIENLISAYMRNPSGERWQEALPKYLREWFVIPQEAIAARDNYIALLTEELYEVAVIAHIHGWRSTRAEAGEEARERIALADKALKEREL